MAQGHPTAAAMASYTRSRLPFARPQTLQNPPNPPKVRPAPQGKGTPTSPTRATPARKSHHKATAMAQEHHTGAAMASFIGVQRCRLPGLKPSKPSAQHAPLSHAKVTTRPQQWLKSTPRPQQWLLIGVQGCRLPGLKPSIPSKTLQTLQKSGQLRREKVLQQAQHAPLPHAKATTRPQQNASNPPLPAHSPLSLGHSSLPFASLQTLKTPQTLRGSFHQGCSLPFAGTSLAAASTKLLGGQRSSIAACPLPALSPLLFGIRACRLPASTKLLAVSLPALQPALCLHIALSR